MLRVAINGYGRIGRNILRTLFERGLHNKIQIVAINDLAGPQMLTHLTRFDSTFGRFGISCHVNGDTLQVGSHSIRLLREPELVNLPWQHLGVDVVLECTGRVKQRIDAEKHLTAGAHSVLLAHPMADADLTVVYGVNHQLLGNQHIVSNASCTTNCLAPLAKVLHDSVGIKHGLMTTIHAYTNDQNLLDKNHSDLYRARAAAHSMIPTSTGAAKAIGLVIPELDGRLDGLAVRVPTMNVSLVDLSFTASRNTSVAEINEILRAGARHYPEGVMECNEEALVSCDFNGYPVSSVADLTQTRVHDSLVKVLAWYDNEWAFSNRMLDTLLAWHG
jgi:glyceraldehyde 3-phosphate dehydrogenase